MLFRVVERLRPDTSKLVIEAQKEQAFEEASKLKNQFRSLDDDEIGFLDEVQEKERLKEAQARKETAEELQAFRKQQLEAERKASVSEKNDDSQTAKNMPDTTWQTKKRRRKDGDGAAPKIRKMSTGDKSPDPPVETVTKNLAAENITSSTETKATSPSTSASNGLGLGAYDDSDDD